MVGWVLFEITAGYAGREIGTVETEEQSNPSAISLSSEDCTLLERAAWQRGSPYSGSVEEITAFLCILHGIFYHRVVMITSYRQSLAASLGQE